jgi:hypothetical protein
MFCPICKSEYREGFYRCVDCDVDLVSELPQEPKEEADYIDLVEVFETNQQSDIALLKSIFDAEGIPYYFQSESPIFIGYGVFHSKLLVKSDDVQRVKEILQDFGML